MRFAQGYGLTETCAASFIADPYDSTQASTVGAPVPGLLARLESIKEMSYDARRDPPQGELLTKGAAVFSGYHKRQDLTAEALGAAALAQPACVRNCTLPSRLALMGHCCAPHLRRACLCGLQSCASCRAHVDTRSSPG